MSRIRLLDCSKINKSWKNANDITIFQHDVIVKFFWHCFILFSNLVTGPSFMSISPLVLELKIFSFIKDWPEIRKSKIPPSEFFSVPGNWGKLGIPKLARMSLIKFYWMLQNARVTASTVSVLLRKNQQGVKLPLHPD